MQIKDITAFLEQRFPLYLQEDFDNCGVQCGDVSQEVTGVLVCFEMSIEVVEEAIAKGANLVISHHPLMLKRGICKIQPTDRVGEILCKALEHKMVLYSMHTNIDSAQGGGNDAFAERLGLQHVSVLVPQSGHLRKVVVFVPSEYAETMRLALAEVGCGKMGSYDQCAYTMSGTGSFRPLSDAHPFVGNTMQDEKVPEERVEMIFPAPLLRKVVSTIYRVHPYEEPAFDILRLENASRTEGLGRVGMLPQPMPMSDFLRYLQEKMQITHLRYAGDGDKMIHKVAVCGGGGASFIEAAMAAGADAYVTGDIKYHDFFRAHRAMTIVDVGHYEGEFFIKEIIYKELKENFSTFAVSIAEMEKIEIFYL
ncbi:MAG: Nif3-like dinuclear metal center hexameric protein [Bacteroidales bacterium]|nr:Nif3-like dinuclear metal center hexameric protein [Bacteroidales bacterium]